MQRRTQRTAVYALIVDKALNVLLVRAGAKSATPGSWYLPGGGIKFGESPDEAVVREVQEETGLVIDVGELRMALSDVTNNDRDGVETHTIRLIYEATASDGRLRDEPDGSSDLAKWYSAMRIPSEAMPFVATAIATMART